ncbi:MAG: light-harvesting antenna LH1, alpha subunit [Thiohalocapsa sp.]
MFQDVFNYKPKEQDYRTWLVVNPATWLVPILAAVLVIALAVHSMVFSLPQYTWGAEEAVAAEAPAAVEAPAPPAAPAQ